MFKFIKSSIIKWRLQRLGFPVRRVYVLSGYTIVFLEDRIGAIFDPPLYGKGILLNNGFKVVAYNKRWSYIAIK